MISVDLAGSPRDKDHFQTLHLITRSSAQGSPTASVLYFIPVEDRRLPPPDVQEKLTGESPAKTGAQIKFEMLQKRESGHK